ncbi:HAMP domain-containing sensor histidine kinase [Nitriliruptor alkaliphilus]|uniref:HAMP domain-containing sensor histidine kinase n=1 Tax=Nitriliruptor alkaliphilus TaxID=427918 RepID=UPI000695DB3B|nr:HAMP domain-containing sensor histidine kinase [Nitriliruptor alkaliphilus]
MRTPSLRRRVTASGVAVFVVLVLLLDAFVYLTLQARLEETLDEVLATRAELARELSEQHGGIELAERLSVRGVPAAVTTGDGVQLDTESIPRFEAAPPAPPADQRARRLSTTIALPDGGSVEVFVSSGGVDATLRRVLLVTMLGTAIAVVAAVLLFRRAAAVAIAPLDQVVAAARRTASGQTGERLEPDAPDTELGRFATAYDAMLDSLETALEDTQRTEERTRRFLDDAAHQLRTPLATVRASVEALLREEDPAVRDLLMANLVREVSRADRLLTSLLTLARLDAGQPLATAPTDLVALAHDEAERCRSIAPHLAVEVDATHAPTTLPAGDEGSLRELLANLLDNARRHATDLIVVTIAAADEGTVEVHVRDDGPGIADDDVAVERAFQRFASLDGRGGSGLGLAIGRAIAEGHGGTLTYEERSFVLRLPAAAPPTERSATAQT